MTTTSLPTVVLPVEMPGTPRPDGRGRVLVVTDPDLGAVIVRWKLGGNPAWTCKACGVQHAAAGCAHVYAAALLLAGHLLGLETTHPIPDGATALDDTTRKDLTS